MNRIRRWEKEYKNYLADSNNTPLTLEVMEQLFRPTASLNMFSITLHDAIGAEIARKCNQLINGNTVESATGMKEFLRSKLGELARSKEAPVSIRIQENPVADLVRRILYSISQVDNCFSALKASPELRTV